MSRGAVKLFLLGYFLIYFGAVFLRIDFFPLSWVPMYGMRDTEPVLTIPVGDLEQMALGFRVERANGEVDYMSHVDLNIPPANFRRLYYQRAFGLGPPQHQRERAELHPFNNWWYERLIGPDPLQVTDYQRQLLESFNKTFELLPGDPDYIVRIEARSLFAGYTREMRNSGNLKPDFIEERTALIAWDGTTMESRPADAR